MPQQPLSNDELFNLMGRHGVTGDLARIMVTGALIESGGVPDEVGDSGHSVGLYQMHDRGLGAGLTFQQRADPDFATDQMKVHYAASFAQGQQAGLQDRALATQTYMDTEKPFGFPDPNLTSTAATTFADRFDLVQPPAGGASQSGSIEVDATVEVATSDGLWLHSQPDVAPASRLLLISNGTFAMVIDGPRPANNFTFWKLQLNGAQGWAAGEFLAVRSVPLTGNRFANGSMVFVTGVDGTVLRLRDRPSTAGLVLLDMNDSTPGRVIGGPEIADGHTWWQLLVTSGTVVRGWAAGEFLAPGTPVTMGPEESLDARVLEPRQWIPLDAPIKNGTEARSSQNYDQVIDQFGVEKNPRYAPHSPLTFCNIFVSDVTRAMNAQIPHRVNENGDPDDNGGELLCKGMVEWLHSHQQAAGWTQVADAAEAQSHAAQGQPAVVITPATATTDEEHTAIIRSTAMDPGLGADMAQAGSHCHSHVRLLTIFGSRPVEFWVHP